MVCGASVVCGKHKYMQTLNVWVSKNQHLLRLLSQAQGARNTNKTETSRKKHSEKISRNGKERKEVEKCVAKIYALPIFSAPFFRQQNLQSLGQVIFVRNAVWREGRTGATSGVSNRENELRRGRHNNRRGFEKMKTYFGHGLKNSHKIYKHYIFTCILLICQHYKLSGRTRKYEK